MLFSNLLLASVASAGVINLPLRVRELSQEPEVFSYLAKRANSHHTTAEMGDIQYETDIEVGSPPQKVHVTFDTGSPLLWLAGTNSTQCEANKCNGTPFDPRKSSSWKYRTEGANWGGHGIWGNETVSYAGETLEDFQVYVSTDKILNARACFGQSPNDDPSKSFVQGLAASGKISRAIYSLNAEKPIFSRHKPSVGIVSNVYYGGFDKAKYEGVLTTVNCDKKGGYGMPLGALSINGEKVPTKIEHSVILDTGGIALHLPNSTLELLSKKFGGEGIYEHPGYWRIGCGSNAKLTYEFGETKVDVDFSEYILPSLYGGCRLEGVVPEKDDRRGLLSGPALISKMLVIYDNDRSQVTVGKAKYTDESDVVEITGDIPGAVPFKKE